MTDISKQGKDDLNVPDGAFSRTMRIDIIPDSISPSDVRPVPRIRGEREIPKPALHSDEPHQSETDIWKGRYEALFESMYDAALITDAAGLIESSNSRATDFLLFSRAELQGQNIIDFISGADENLLQNLVSDMKHQRFALIQAYCIRRDGSFFPAEISLSLADSYRNKLCFFMRDVTLRKQKEDELLRWHNAIQHAGSGIAVSDLAGTLIYVNPITADMWGYAQPSDLLGKSVSDLWAEDDASGAAEMINFVVHEREKRTGDFAARRRDGSVFHAQVLIGRNEDSEGVLTGLVFSFVDISERIKAMGRLRELDETKSRFVAEVSHELRTPLAIISEFVSLVNDEITGPVNEKQKECLESALKNCERLSTLINTMLDLARIEAGRANVDRKRQAIGPILTECYNNFLPTCRHGKQKLLLNVTENCPDVYCDIESVNKIMINLVGNAVKFTPEGGTINIGCCQAGQFIRVFVKDTGRGISQEAQQAIFEAFWQVEREHGPGAKGTGLGLAIVKKLVELNGGMVALESVPGEGSCFSFTLPLYDKDARAPVRVLVVDDDPIVIELITKAIKRYDLNLDVRSTLSGLESLRIAGEYNPDMVILDVRLKDIGGDEIIGLLKQQVKSDTQVKVLAISGDPANLDHISDKGADDCLLKPFDSHSLMGKIKSLMSKRLEEGKKHNG